MRMRDIRDGESGQVIVFTCLSMGVLLGFMGLAIDVGRIFRARRDLQLAADAAATAAALDYHYNLSVTSARTAGRAASSANGYTNGTVVGPGTVQVTISMPPSRGPFASAGYSSYAEALVEAPQAGMFMGYLGFPSFNVGARAVAGNPPGKGCMFVVGSGPDTLDLKGKYSIAGMSGGQPTCTAGQQQTCGIYVASTDAAAVKVTGNAGCVNANFVDVAGGYSGHLTQPTPISTNVGKIQGDPFATQVATAPTLASCTTNTVPAATTTITNAVLASVTPSAAGVVCFAATNPTLANGLLLNTTGSTPMIYVFENGVTIGVGATVQFGSGTYSSTTNTFSSTVGATMEILTGTLNQASNSLLNIYAPTSGPTDGIAIMEPSTNSTALQVNFGSNNETLDGYIYAPGASVSTQDNGGGVTATGIVAGKVAINQTSLTLPNYNTANPNTTPLSTIVLVE
jgi:hypothetical protein